MVTATRDTSHGIVRDGETYLAQEFRRRMALGEWAWRQLRRKGLPVTRAGRNVYVDGTAARQFLAAMGS